MIWTPFNLAIALTIITWLFAFALTLPEHATAISHAGTIFSLWQTGFGDLLTFGMQMMLMLVLGNVLAQTPYVSKKLEAMVPWAKSPVRAVVLVGAVSMITGLINWGLGLVVGAIIAKRVGDYTKAHNIPAHFPLIGAAGYLGLMVWHGGLSGSASLKLAESHHFLHHLTGTLPIRLTLLSSTNLWATGGVCIVMLITLAILAKHYAPQATPAPQHGFTMPSAPPVLPKLHWTSTVFGAFMVIIALVDMGYHLPEVHLTPNGINFALLGWCLILTGSFSNFSRNVADALPTGTGIFIQFPFYAGIAAVMSGSGLIQMLSSEIIHWATPQTFPIIAMLSAGLVNIFIPSGGGQLAVQGPILFEAANHLGVSLGKTTLAFSYGDQLTNMLQPFWALPLLAITGLKATDILPFTALLMTIASVIFSLSFFWV